MSGYILCQTKKAERPYYIENISMNIYSIEELCYYLYHNLYLADHTIFNEELCSWIRDELELPHLAANGMYVNAIQVYQKILERDDLNQQRKDFAAAVRYNLGCAYSYLFQMEKAQECFLQAYKESQSAEALKAYVTTYASIHDKTDYDKVMEELGVDDKVKKDIKEEIQESMKTFASVPEKKIDEENLDALLEKLMKEYHRSTGS